MANKKRVSNIVLDEVSMVGKGANGGAHIVLMKAVTKKEMGEDFPETAFAYVPDSDKPSTWKLRLWDSLDKKETASQVGRAVAALGKGFRGKKVQIPSEDIGKVKKKVLSAWLKVNKDKTRKDAPDVLKILKMEGKTFDEIMDNKELKEKLWNAVYTLEDSLFSIMQDKTIEDKSGKLNESTSQFQAKLAEIKKGDNMDELEKVKKEIEELQKKLDAVVEKSEALEKENEDLKVELAKSKDDNGEEINKDELPENVRKHFEDMEKQNKENTELISKLLEKQENDTYIGKAQAFENLTVKAEDFGPVLRKISKALETEEMDNLLKMLTAANEAIGKGELFKAQGNDGEGDTGKTAIAKMEAKAEELMKVDPKLTKAKAIVKVMEIDPTLYNEYTEEQASIN